MKLAKLGPAGGCPVRRRERQTSGKYAILLDSNIFLCFTELLWCIATYEILRKDKASQPSGPRGWLSCARQDESSTEQDFNLKHWWTWPRSAERPVSRGRGKLRDKHPSPCQAAPSVSRFLRLLCELPSRTGYPACDGGRCSWCISLNAESRGEEKSTAFQCHCPECEPANVRSHFTIIVLIIYNNTLPIHC